jgi:predicted acyl esterase
VQIDREGRVPMRDGVVLRAEVYDRGRSKFPVLDFQDEAVWEALHRPERRRVQKVVAQRVHAVVLQELFAAAMPRAEYSIRTAG